MSRSRSTTGRLKDETNTEKYMNYGSLTEEQEQAIGEALVEAFGLKEAKHGTHPRNLKSYDPPRYYTQWGTKTALGVARTAYGILSQQHKKTV